MDFSGSEDADAGAGRAAARGAGAESAAAETAARGAGAEVVCGDGDGPRGGSAGGICCCLETAEAADEAGRLKSKSASGKATSAYGSCALSSSPKSSDVLVRARTAVGAAEAGAGAGAGAGAVTLGMRKADGAGAGAGFMNLTGTRKETGTRRKKIRFKTSRRNGARPKKCASTSADQDADEGATSGQDLA